MPAHPSVIQGHGQACVICACFLGADSRMGLPVDSEACTHHSTGCGHSVTRWFFPARDGRGKPAVPGNALVARCNRSPKINNHCDCTPGPISLPSHRSQPRVLLGSGHSDAGIEVMWQSSLLKLLPFGFPKTYCCLPKRFCVYMFFSTGNC